MEYSTSRGVQAAHDRIGRLALWWTTSSKIIQSWTIGDFMARFEEKSQHVMVTPSYRSDWCRDRGAKLRQRRRQARNGNTRERKKEPMFSTTLRTRQPITNHLIAPKYQITCLPWRATHHLQHSQVAKYAHA
jgi:hypothetical protein